MPHRHRIDQDELIVKPGSRVKLRERDAGRTPGLKDREEAEAAMVADKEALAEAQERLWASQTHGVLVVFQAMDAAGKDGTIKHVLSGVNPQGVEVRSFKAPNDEERLHHFLWRPSRALPARGRMTIFNRSYYEEVLVVRVHPEFLGKQFLPEPQRRAYGKARLDKLWKLRYDDINRWEDLAHREGICIIKFFLHVSRDEQRRRFLDRLQDQEKNWKFSPTDFRERQHWDAYREAYQDMLAATSTEAAPWYVIPADDKWYMRAAVADIISARIGALDLRWPTVAPAVAAEFATIRAELEREVAAG